MTHTLPLLLALACASDPTTAGLPDSEAVQAVEFAALTSGDAARLEGKRARYRVRVRALALGGRGWPNVLDAPAGVSGVMDLRRPICVGAYTVEAELCMVHFPPTVDGDGTPLPGRWDYRLVKAAVVRP
jgi:hypothetical protein